MTTQNEYVTTYSGTEYLQGTLEIGITTDEDISGISMGISHYNGMGVGLPYGGLIEEYDFTMSSLSGATIYGGHNMFPQDYYIPAGTTDETLMYIPILISEINDEEFCIQSPGFSDTGGNSLNVILDENSCISIEDMTLSGIPVVIINDGAEDAEAEMGSTFTLDATSSFDPEHSSHHSFSSMGHLRARVLDRRRVHIRVRVLIRVCSNRSTSLWSLPTRRIQCAQMCLRHSGSQNSITVEIARPFASRCHERNRLRKRSMRKWRIRRPRRPTRSTRRRLHQDCPTSCPPTAAVSP